MNLQKLLDELESQKATKWDKKVEARGVNMSCNGDGLRLNVIGRDEPLAVTSPCHSQFADRLDIPVKYYNRMMEQAPDLLVENVNRWLRSDESRRFFVRGMNGSVRALLGDRYRVIDHQDVMMCALNELQAHEAKVETCFLSETELNVKIKSERLRDSVRNRDDLIMGGLLLTNSETGHKALRLEPRLFRVLCSNGLVVEQLVSRQVHVGVSDGVNDMEVYLNIRRSIQELFGQFGDIVATLRLTTEVKIKKPQEVIRNVVEHYRLTESQRDSILMAFGAEPDADQYGVVNAVTRAAQSEDTWEKSMELERLGGALAALSPNQFVEFDA